MNILSANVKYVAIINVNTHKETLIKLIWEKPSTRIAKEYEVSDTTICQWCRKCGIKKPPRGYWTNKHFLGG